MYIFEFYNDLNSITAEIVFAGKTELSCITEFKADEEKIIDDDFFAFEAKKMKITFIDNNSEVSNWLKGQINSDDYLERNFPVTLEGFSYPSVITKFINRKLIVKMESSGDTIFIGVPDATSVTIDFETGSYSIEYVSIPYLIFDNFEELSSLNMFDSYLANSWLPKPFNGTKYPCEILTQLLPWICENGIYISKELVNFTINQSGTINLNGEEILIYKNSESFGKKAVLINTEFSLHQFNEELTPRLTCVSNLENLVDFDYEQYVVTKTNIPINFYFRKYHKYNGGHGGNNGVWNTILFYTENSTPFYMKSSLPLHADMETFTFYQYNPTLSSFLDVRNNGELPFDNNQYNLYSKSIVKDSNGNITGINIVITGTETVSEVDGFGVPVQQHYTNLFLNDRNAVINGLATNLPTTIIAVPGKDYSYVVCAGFPRVLLTGTVTPLLKLVTTVQSDNTYAITNESHGIFNPDSFSLKDFFKCMLLLAGDYFVYGYSNGLPSLKCEPFPVFSFDSEPKIIPCNLLLKLNMKNTFIDLDKQFSEIDFSETDWHYLLKAFVFKYKSLSGNFQRAYSCELLKTTETVSLHLEVFSIVSISPFPDKTINGFINSISEEEDYYSFEVIEFSQQTNTVNL